MDAILISVLEDYFGESVKEVNSVEAKINGHWYQVIDSEDSRCEDEEFTFIKEEGIEHWYNDKLYYIVAQ